MPHAKQLSNRKRRSRAAPVLGAAGLLALASSASAEAMSTANTEMSHQLFLGEEEISDVSLSTFHVFDKEKRRFTQVRRAGRQRWWRLRRRLRRRRL
jgi:hypothetical protein